LIGAYRKDDFADPESYLLQLGMVLERYPQEVIETVTSPFTGLQSRKNFPPTIAEVTEACNAEAANLERRAKLAEMRRQSILEAREQRQRERDWERTAPGRRATVFVPPDAPRYATMCDRVQTADPAEWRYDGERAGIWVSRGMIE
jgi:hypothetical protein